MSTENETTNISKDSKNNESLKYLHSNLVCY